jgi:RES domain-containing protein
MLEALVHLTDREDDLPRTFTLLEVEISEALAVRDLMPLAEADCKRQQQVTQRIGDAWLASRETPLARVPSAIMPHTWNVLLNPEHPEAEGVKIANVIRERFDGRLFRFGAR